MYVVASSFSKVRKENYLRRSGYYDSIHGLTTDIPMADRDPWDGRPSVDYLGHKQKESSASNVSGDQLYRHGEYNSTPSHPGNAYYQDSRQLPNLHYQTGYEEVDAPHRV
jgi:hypothetical protein